MPISPTNLSPPDADRAVYRNWSDVPEAARALLGARVRLHYECVAATYHAVDRYLKVQPIDTFPSLAGEARRLKWLASFLSVPEVIAVGHNDQAEWLCTRAMPGRDATKFVSAPERIVPIFARGLRHFHDALPVDDCRFSFRHDVALPHVQRRLSRIDPRGWHPAHAGMTVEQAFERLSHSPPEEDDLVVCHGDYCFPNVLVEGDRVTSWLDVGELGVASRWRDLAVATWTCTWNVGPGYEELFLAEYGASLDRERRKWFRLLYDMAS